VAQEVKLTSSSGGLSVNGILLSFDGDTYQVDTDLGRITISNTDLICEGKGCPAQIDRVEAFSIIPTNRIPHNSILDLLEAYAQNSNKKLKRVGSFATPTSVEISVPGEKPESIISFKSGEQNLGFSSKSSGAAVGFDAVQITSTSPLLREPLSSKALQDIWTGIISNWEQLGGPNKKIRVILPIYAEDLFMVFERFNSKLTRETLTPSAEYFLSPSAIRTAVTSDPLAIGLIYKTQSSLETVEVEMGCSLIAKPSDFTIQSLEYPFAFQLNLTGDVSKSFRTAQLLQDFAVTKESQNVFDRVGLVPLVGRRISDSRKAKRISDAILATGETVNLAALQKFTRFSQTATRVATTLYFNSDGKTLDQVSQKALNAFVHAIKTSPATQSKFILAGFSDSLGKQEDNLKISLNRAETVRAAMGHLNSEIETLGFADAAPIGCNETEFGRYRNRRVEIWIEN
jgi:phosphate transport system substrate-binding protein